MTKIKNQIERIINIPFFILTIFICSCNNSKVDNVDRLTQISNTILVDSLIAKQNLEGKESINENSVIIDDIEKRISAHSTFFLSYWAGMTATEKDEVTLYLIQKGKLISDPNTSRIYYNFNSGINEYKMEVYFLDHCTENFHSGLHSVRLSLSPIISSDRNSILNSVSLNEYNEIANMYKEKYKTIKGNSGQWCSLKGRIGNFSNNTTYVTVQYCGGDDNKALQEYLNGKGMTHQLLIDYSDENYKREDAEYSQRVIQNEKQQMKKRKNNTQSDI